MSGGGVDVGMMHALYISMFISAALSMVVIRLTDVCKQSRQHDKVTEQISIQQALLLVV
jgi:hypothetical protein